MSRRKRQKVSLLRRFCLFFMTVFSVVMETECGLPKQKFANEPSPQTAVIGTTVVLPCRIINKVGELQWTRDGFGLGNERALYAFKRYFMIGSDEEGDFSLKISPVTLEDDAEFQCQVTGANGVMGVRSQTAKLTVYVPPESPEIVQGSVVQSTAGAGVQLECVSKAGKPAAEIQWLDSSGRVIIDGVKYDKTLLSDGHRYNSRSTLTFIAGREHHNGVFTCTATNPALHQSLKTQVRLEVTFPPEVSIIHNKDEGYKEGETAILTCSASANPNKLSFKWYRGGKLVSDSNQTKLLVEDVNRDDNLEDITCEVSNEVGTSKKITRLAVHYGPKFRINPKDVFADEGENVTLKCQVDGSPKPKIVWIPQKNSSYIYGTGPTLTLTASKETIGTYLCLAKVEDFPEISTTVGLFLKDPPTVRAEPLQWGIISVAAYIECFVPSATPNSVQVTWIKGESPIDLANGRYVIDKEISGDGVLVRLVIKSTQIDDFDAYNCSVQNAFGSDMAQVFLRRKKTIPLLFVLTGVVGGVVFILIVAAGVIVYGRRKAARQKDAKKGGLPEKSGSLQLNDQNSSGNESDLKVEIDNRTGSSLSTKELPEVETAWEKERDNPGTPTYLSNASSYLYPESFTGIPIKVNGHAGTVGTLPYGDYNDHMNLPSKTPIPQPHNIQSPYTNNGGAFSPRGHPSLVSATQHNLYQPYHKEYSTAVPADNFEGLKGLSSAYSNGYTGQSFKSNASTTLPLSLQVNRNGGGSPAAGPTSGGGLVPQLTNVGNNNSTIPRLGIPVDPSQYIVSPRTQVLQGALATHV